VERYIQSIEHVENHSDSDMSDYEINNTCHEQPDINLSNDTNQLGLSDTEMLSHSDVLPYGAVPAVNDMFGRIEDHNHEVHVFNGKSVSTPEVQLPVHELPVQFQDAIVELEGQDELSSDGNNDDESGIGANSGPPDEGPLFVLNADFLIDYGDELDDQLNDNNSGVSGDSDMSDGSEFSDDRENETEKLEQSLAEWANNFNISHSALSDLLSRLQVHHPALPKDPRTLLHTDITYSSHIREIPGGWYFHFGIKKCVLSKLTSYQVHSDEIQSVSLQVNIDGLPLFKSSSGQFWPILAFIEELPKKDPFVVGLFYGTTKPKDVADYLGDFRAEMILLQENGIRYGDQVFDVRLSAFVCDTPARVYIKSVKGHSGYYGCDKCTQRGVYHEGRMTFPEINAPRRTDGDFHNIADFEHHHTGPCPLIGVNVGMVSQFPLDYMHLVCLGVMRRLIALWRKGPLNTRLSAREIESISQSLVMVRSFVPSEFARKPRSLLEVDRWKATEFRQFLLYTGPVVLLGKIPNPLYQNFMLLSVGVRILLSPAYCRQPSRVDYAHDLLVLFVQHCGDLYDRKLFVYNVHGLVHLADEVRLHGCLDNISAFPFENFLGQLKKLVRQPNFPLQQVIRRLSERKEKSVVMNNIHRPQVKQRHSDGPVLPNMGACKQYKELLMESQKILVKEGDNCVKVNDCIGLVRNILVMNMDKLYILVEYFHRISDFFDYPLSSKKIGIYRVSQLRRLLTLVPVPDIQSKYVLLPEQGRETSIAMPLLHSD
jgi:hypothetical protein